MAVSSRSVPGLVVSGFMIATIAALAMVRGSLPDLHHRIVQEDEILEWATFWAFAVAVGWCGVGAFAQRRSGAIPWFLVGLGLFCAFVALEEISYGQRVLGFRAPSYFLENNYQLELNLHNFAGESLRRFVMGAILGGYGVLLPLAARVPVVGAALGRMGVVAPPLELSPGFAAAFALHWVEPWPFGAEVVELLLGVGILGVVVLRAMELRAEAPSREPNPSRGPNRVGRAVALSLAGIFAIGAVNVELGNHRRAGDARALEAAQLEVRLLGKDFRPVIDLQVLKSARAGLTRPASCGLDARAFEFAKTSRSLGFGERLWEGGFSQRERNGVPAERTRFFLDPWNAPYWIAHYCENGRQAAFVYSFGPNRRRDSEGWKISGDDVVEFLIEPR